METSLVITVKRITAKENKIYLMYKKMYRFSGICEKKVMLNSNFFYKYITINRLMLCAIFTRKLMHLHTQFKRNLLVFFKPYAFEFFFITI